MTDNEIIKGLECCGTPYFNCFVCPLCEMENIKCSTELFANALDLINRKQKEIERLEAENNRFADIGKMYSEIKAEAVKEFAEKLKENKIDVDVSYGYGREHYTEAVAVIEIDNLVKEMVGDS